MKKKDIIIPNESVLAKHIQMLEKITYDHEVKNAKDEALLESIGEGVIATDNQGKITLINTSALNMFGLIENKSKGKLFTTVFTAYDEKGLMIPLEDQVVPFVLRTGKKAVLSKYYYKSKSKNKFPASTTTSPVIYHKRTVGTVTIFRNIIKEIEADKAKSEFVSIASHQLRNPLTAIKLFTEILQSGVFESDPKHSKEILGHIEESNEKMIRLVNNLLNMTQLENGQIKVVPTLTDLDFFIRSILDELRPFAKEKQIKLVFKIYDSQSSTINIDKLLIHQVLSNLISNAIEYSPKKTKIHVCVEKKDKNTQMIKIQDQGIGIPKDSMKKIFDRFYRADNAIRSKSDGTGLGLYVCKLIVEAHGGKIWVESEENHGSTFYVTLSSKIVQNDI